MLQKVEFRECIIEMIRRAETRLPRDIVLALERCKREETDGLARLQLECMLKNLDLARKLKAPICQDTGTFTFFVRLDPELRLGFDLFEELARGVEEATRSIPLRENLVDPFSRVAGSGPVRPAIYLELAEKGEFEIDLLVKGSGAENWSGLHMLEPTEGAEAIKKSSSTRSAKLEAEPCPPTLVGVRVGGSGGGLLDGGASPSASARHA